MSITIPMKSLTPEHLYNRICSAWPDLGTSWLSATGKGMRTQRTALLKKWLREEGRKLNPSVYPDPDAKGHGEYLCDLVWGLESTNTKAWRDSSWAWGGITLAVESELAPSWDEILHDFDKLLDVKATLKAMFCAPTRPMLGDLAGRLSLRLKDTSTNRSGTSTLL